MGTRSTQQRRRSAARNASPGVPLWSLFALGIAAAAVLGGAIYLATSPFRARPSAATGGPYVVVSMDGFNPNPIRVSGPTAALTFVNSDSEFHTDGGGWHQFRVEALNLDVRIAPRSDKAVTLTGLTPGTYEFYCDICCGGKGNPAMRGVLEVTG